MGLTGETGKQAGQQNCAGAQSEQGPPLEKTLSVTLLENLHVFTPKLRAYAALLLGSIDEADDLVQDTLLRAWRYRHTFQPNTNLKAWLFRILRNEFLTRAGRPRPVQDYDGELAATLVAPGDPELRLQCDQTLRALQTLTPKSRDALVLVAAGNSYEELAEIWGCAVGTVKSRIARARQSLLDALDDHDDPRPARMERHLERHA
ncbi:sigma-70 family RNA polymerase sigma factor [Phenylobacterium soli]|uniref:RNA polymerase sigma factor n=1 Tax=Phenylobacterium soli TaxID=2170551 RepID=A0A328AMK5_9CAUL|nr:sigma-70 family RNA polymerase sigma factor [Phenylobacterium soli]RAK56120.1 RNA polymerase subunit sigma [Phenylobacterium soli]